MIEFTIPGNPIPLSRPRTWVRGGRSVTYNPQQKLIDQIKDCLRAFKIEMIDKPIEIKILFYMQVPSSYSLKKQKEMMDQPHVKRPDIDNLIKFILDAMNGIILKDDSMIFSLQARKCYGDPKTIVNINVME